MVWTVQNIRQSQAIQEIEDAESDRVVAIVAGAFVEERLRFALEYRLREGAKRDGSTPKSKMFELNGPLGSFAAKIDMGFLLYMYGEPTLDTLHAICKIRNRFAHELLTGFDVVDKVLQKQLPKLKLHEGLTHYPVPVGPEDMEIEPIDGPRRQFLVNVKIVLSRLMSDNDLHSPYMSDFNQLALDRKAAML